jgi:replicative DNA helicase
MTMLTDTRIPPHNQLAESAVIGSILLNNEVFKGCKAIIEPDHFYNQANRTIWNAIVRMYDAAKPVDIITLSQEIQDGDGSLNQIGGAATLSKLLDDVVTSENAMQYARIVAELAARRKMIYAAQEVVARGYGAGDSTEDYLANSRQAIVRAASYLAPTSSGPRHLDEDAMDVIREISSGKLQEGVLSTGLRGIDYFSGGLWPGLLHVLAGRPAMGKSLAALNIANNVSQAGHKVLYVVLEDTRKMAVYRMFARYADLDVTDLMMGRVSQYDEFARLRDAMVKISGKKPLWIDDTTGLTSAAVAQIAASHKIVHGLDLLIVDHLHEVADKGENETIITTKAAQTFRDIAKDLNIPVLLISQLNREVESARDRRPLLKHLRQSGAIEAVARVVWFMYREGYYTKEENRRDAEWIIAKANYGRTGVVRTWMNMSRMYIRDWNHETDGQWPSETPGLVVDHQQ